MNIILFIVGIIFIILGWLLKSRQYVLALEADSQQLKIWKKSQDKVVAYLFLIGSWSIIISFFAKILPYLELIWLAVVLITTIVLFLRFRKQ